MSKIGAFLQLNVSAAISMHSKEVLDAIGRTNKAGLDYFAKAVAERASRLAPVRSGLLRSSINGSVRKIYRGAEGDYTASIRSATKGGTQPDHWYRGRHFKARFITYGYGADVEVGRPAVFGMKPYTPHPYLHPAFDEKVKQLPRIMQAIAIREGMRQRTDASRLTARLGRIQSTVNANWSAAMESGF